MLHMTRGFSPPPMLSLTCTTSLAPAASAKVTPLQSRTTTLTGSATRMGEGTVPRCFYGSCPNLPPVIPSHLHQMGHLSLGSPVSREGDSIPLRHKPKHIPLEHSGPPQKTHLPPIPREVTLPFDQVSPCLLLQAPDAAGGCGETAHRSQSTVVLDSSGCRVLGPEGAKGSEGQRNICI